MVCPFQSRSVSTYAGGHYCSKHKRVKEKLKIYGTLTDSSYEHQLAKVKLKGDGPPYKRTEIIVSDI